LNDCDKKNGSTPDKEFSKQVIFNSVLALLLAFGGWWTGKIWGYVEILQEKVEQLRIEEAHDKSQYLLKNDFYSEMERLSNKLDSMRDLIYSRESYRPISTKK